MIVVPWAHEMHIIAEYTHSRANRMLFVCTLQCQPLYVCVETKTEYTIIITTHKSSVESKL